MIPLSKMIMSFKKNVFRAVHRGRVLLDHNDQVPPTLIKTCLKDSPSCDRGCIARTIPNALKYKILFSSIISGKSTVEYCTGTEQGGGGQKDQYCNTLVTLIPNNFRITCHYIHLCIIYQ